MKKTLTGLIILLFTGSMTIKAQSGKETKPPPPPPPKTTIDEKIKVKEPRVITVKGRTADEFYKKNPSVTDISRQENIITVKKKDGTTEKYDMSKKEEDKSFTEKYGLSPIPPPPPPSKTIIDEKIKVKPPPPPPPANPKKTT